MWQLITLVQIAILASATSIAPKNWEIPTPESMQNSLSYCSEVKSYEQGTTLEAQLVHCIATELGLWTDEEGFNAKRIAKMFSRYKQTEELLVVIEYCNHQTKPVDTTTTTTDTTSTKWAYAAYKCATVGRIGQWLQDYIQSPPPQKVVNHKKIQEIYF